MKSPSDGKMKPLFRRTKFLSLLGEEFLVFGEMLRNSSKFMEQLTQQLTKQPTSVGRFKMAMKMHCFMYSTSTRKTTASTLTLLF
jgi:hypothetical protein